MKILFKYYFLPFLFDVISEINFVSWLPFVCYVNFNKTNFCIDIAFIVKNYFLLIYQSTFKTKSKAEVEVH